MAKNSSTNSHFTKNVPINSEVNVPIEELGRRLSSGEYFKQDSLDYIFCDQCEWNGFPDEKIVRVFHGLRPEYEDGFIYNYTEYDYNPLDNRRIEHIHKYDQKLIDEQLRIALENQKGVNDVK